MPTYEYRCMSCEFLFEETLTMTRRKEPCETECPKCHEQTVTQEIRTAPGAAIDSTLKPDGAFKEVISKIHKNCVGSKIPIDKYV